MFKTWICTLFTDMLSSLVCDLAPELQTSEIPEVFMKHRSDSILCFVMRFKQLHRVTCCMHSLLLASLYSTCARFRIIKVATAFNEATNSKAVVPKVGGTAPWGGAVGLPKWALIGTRGGRESFYYHRGALVDK
jgi:hypothetical protein